MNPRERRIGGSSLLLLTCLILACVLSQGVCTSHGKQEARRIPHASLHLVHSAPSESLSTRLSRKIGGLYDTITRISARLNNIKSLQNLPSSKAGKLSFRRINDEVHADSSRKDTLRSAVDVVKSKVQSMEQGVKGDMAKLATNTKSQLEALHDQIDSITHKLHGLLRAQMARKQNHAALLSGLQKLPAVLAEMQASMEMVKKHGVVPKGFGKMIIAISDIRKKIQRTSRVSIATAAMTPAVFSGAEGLRVQKRLEQGIHKRVHEVPHITKTLKQIFWKKGPESADMNSALESADANKLEIEEKSLAKLAANKKMSHDDIQIREKAISHERTQEHLLREHGDDLEAKRLVRGMASDKKLIRMDEKQSQLDTQDISAYESDVKNRKKDFILREKIGTIQHSNLAHQRNQHGSRLAAARSARMTSLADLDSSRAKIDRSRQTRPRLVALAGEDARMTLLSKKLEVVDLKLRRADANRKRLKLDMMRRKQDEKLRSVDRKLGDEAKLRSQLISVAIHATSTAKLNAKQGLHKPTNLERFQLDRQFQKQAADSIREDRAMMKVDKVDKELRSLDERERALEMKGNEGFDRNNQKLALKVSPKVLTIDETTNDLDGAKLSERKPHHAALTVGVLDERLLKVDKIERIKEVQSQDRTKRDVALRKMDLKVREGLLESRQLGRFGAASTKAEGLIRHEEKEDKKAIKEEDKQHHLDKADQFLRQKDGSSRQIDAKYKITAEQTRAMAAAAIVARVLGHTAKAMLAAANDAAVHGGYCKSGLCDINQLQTWAIKEHKALSGNLLQWATALASDENLNSDVIDSVSIALNMTKREMEKAVSSAAVVDGDCKRRPCARSSLVRWAKHRLARHKLSLKARKDVPPMMKGFAFALLAKPFKSAVEQSRAVASAVAAALGKSAKLLHTEALQAAKSASMCASETCTDVELHEWAHKLGVKEKGALGRYAVALGASMKDNVPDAISKAFGMTAAALYSTAMKAAHAAQYCQTLKECKPKDVKDWAAAVASDSQGQPKMSKLVALASALVKDHEQDSIGRSVDQLVLRTDQLVDAHDITKEETDELGSDVMLKDKSLRNKDKSVLKTIRRDATKLGKPSERMLSAVQMLRGLDSEMKRDDKGDEHKDERDSLRIAADRQLRKLDVEDRGEEVNKMRPIKILKESAHDDRFDAKQLPYMHDEFNRILPSLRAPNLASSIHKPVKVFKVVTAAPIQPPLQPRPKPHSQSRPQTQTRPRIQPGVRSVKVHLPGPHPTVRSVHVAVLPSTQNALRLRVLSPPIQPAPQYRTGFEENMAIARRQQPKHAEAPVPYSQWIRQQDQWNAQDHAAYHRMADNRHIPVDEERDEERHTPESNEQETINRAAVAVVASGLQTPGTAPRYQVDVHHSGGGAYAVVHGGAPKSTKSYQLQSEVEQAAAERIEAGEAAKATDAMRGYTSLVKEAQAGTPSVDVNVQAPQGYTVKTQDSGAGMPVSVVADPVVDTIYK